MVADSLVARVRAFLLQHHLLRSDACLVVAVSGGPDSLCLLHVLWRLRDAGGPALHVAHLDHGFRGDQSAAEAQFVAQTAQAWQIAATVERCDVPALARATQHNKQAAARTARYSMLARVAAEARADAVAVAHHADDQAETVLMHLLRGAGPAGLRGIRPLVPWHEWCPSTVDGHAQGAGPRLPLVRPLLDTSRADIETYCVAYGLAPCIDPSNVQLDYTRNRIRAELVPALAPYNPQVVAALGRTAQVCADDYAYMQAQLDAQWVELAEERPDAVLLRGPAWARLHVALQRYALRRAIQHLAGDDSLSFEQLEAARHAAAREVGTCATPGEGVLLRVEHHGVLLRRREPHVAPQAAIAQAVPQLAREEMPLAVPGSTPIAPAWNLEASYTSPPPAAEPRWQVALDAARLDGPLYVRHRRPGDRFRPAGGAGSKRLQDFFIDHKLPREQRAAWPMLATPVSIVWVVALRADARFLATTQTQHPLWITLKPAGNMQEGG